MVGAVQMDLVCSVLVEALAGLVEGHVEALVDVYDALLLHSREHNSSFDVFPRSLLSNAEILLELGELGQLHLGLGLLLFNSENIGCLLFGGPPPLLSTNIEKKKSRD